MRHDRSLASASARPDSLVWQRCSANRDERITTTTRNLPLWFTAAIELLAASSVRMAPPSVRFGFCWAEAGAVWFAGRCSKANLGHRFVRWPTRERTNERGPLEAAPRAYRRSSSLAGQPSGGSSSSSRGGQSQQSRAGISSFFFALFASRRPVSTSELASIGRSLPSNLTRECSANLPDSLLLSSACVVRCAPN